MRGDESLIDQPLTDQNAEDSVEEGTIAARNDRQMQISQVSRLGPAGSTTFARTSSGAAALRF
jgi:hypothetical protein